MRRALFLHIGLQKTGTSYLQSVMLGSRQELVEQDLDLVLRRRAAFWLMLDVRGRLLPHDPPEASEVLPGLSAMLDDCTGSRALISEESLSPADDTQIDRLLGACGDREVHVILTCRDLARQIPSVWQQGLRSGRRSTFPRYVRRLREAEGTDASIWWQEDLPGVLGRWSRHVPPERIHVVPVPPAGSDHDLLLDRYCSVLGVDARALDREAGGSGNRGLRLEQAEVLRRVNLAVPDELKRRDVYGKVGKRYFSTQILGAVEGRRILLPLEHAAWCREVSQRYVDYVRAGGFDVAGDIDDLLPRESEFATEPPVVTDAELAEAAIRALSEIVTRQLGEEIERAKESGAPAATEAENRGWWRRLRR